MNKRNKTRNECLRFRQNVASGIAWFVLCIAIVCGCNYVADMIAPGEAAVYVEVGCNG